MSHLKVIGAGFGRTGTMSFKTALEILGYRTAHMVSILFDKSGRQLNWWRQVFDGTGDLRALFENIYADFDATCDNPHCLFFAELFEQTGRSAKVVLTVRDPRSWHASLCETVYSVEVVNYLEWYSPIVRAVNSLVMPQSAQTAALLHTMISRWYTADCKDLRKFSDEQVIKLFGDWVAHVKRTIPAENLLVFEVKDGWKPLCQFLNKPIPKEEFPNVNDRAEMLQRMRLMKVFTLLPTVVLALLVVALIVYIVFL